MGTLKTNVYSRFLMQPDNEKIIEAIAAHQVATRKLMQDLLEYNATIYTLEGVFQTLKVLEICHGQPSVCGAISGFAARRRRSDSDISDELEKAVLDAIKEFEARESKNEPDN